MRDWIAFLATMWIEREISSALLAAAQQRRGLKLFQLENLLHPLRVAAGLKGLGQEGLENGPGDANAHHPLTQTKDVGVVVGAGHAGLELGGAHRRPDARNLVGGNAHPDAGPAYQ